MTRLLSKFYKKGSGLMVSKNEMDSYSDEDVFVFEEELLQQQDKKLKKHYLKSDAKAFINKFTRMLKTTKR